MKKNDSKQLLILDSCMLMLPLEQKISLRRLDFLPFSFKIVIPEIVISELEKIEKNKKSSLKQKARFALNIAEKYDILESNLDTHADNEIVRLAKEYNAIVATTDTSLRKRLRNEGIPVITLRGKNELKMIGELKD